MGWSNPGGAGGLRPPWWTRPRRWSSSFHGLPASATRMTMEAANTTAMATTAERCSLAPPLFAMAVEAAIQFHRDDRRPEARSCTCVRFRERLQIGYIDNVMRACMDGDELTGDGKKHAVRRMANAGEVFVASASRSTSWKFKLSVLRNFRAR